MALQTPEQQAAAQRAATRLGITLPETINSSAISNVNTTPKVTTPAPQTAGAGLGGAIQSANDQFTQMMQDKKKEAQANKDKSLSDYTAQLFDTPTQSELQADQYKDQGVNDAQKQLDDINSQIQIEQHALEREKQRIQDNSVGASWGQIQNMMNEAENKSLRKQADLSVIQMGLQGKFNTAKSIADRYVDAAMEKEKNILEALKINYEDNKDLFTTAEQREFETLLSNRNRAYDEEKAAKQQISDYSIEALKYGADGSVITAIRNAKTPEEAQAIAAQFISPIVQQQQSLDIQAKTAQIEASRQSTLNAQQSRLVERAKLGDTTALVALGITSDNSGKVKLSTADAAAVQKEIVSNDAYKAIRKGQDSMTALKAYSDMFDTYGLTGNYSPIANKEMQAKYNAAILNLKEFFNLGVLNGPDEQILRGLLPDPTNQGFLYSLYQGGAAEAGIQNIKNQISQTLDDRYLSLRAQYGNYDETNLGVLIDLDRIYLQNKASIDPNIKKFIDENPNMTTAEKVQVINSKF